MKILFTSTAAVAAAALALGAGAALAGPADSSAPVHNGCLPGYQLLSLASDVPVSENYFVPAALDSSSTGTVSGTIQGSGTVLDGVPIAIPDTFVGNDDGYVCGKRLSAETTRESCPPAALGLGPGCIVPVFYDFTEDDQADVSSAAAAGGE